MTKDKRIPIAMEMAQCPICGNVHSTGIVIGKRLVSEETAKAKEEAINKTPTHYAYCSDCKEKVELGYIAMIEFDEKLTTGEVPYRTGRLMWMREHVFTDIFDPASAEQGLKNRAVYLTQEVFSMIKEMQHPDDQEPSN